MLSNEAILYYANHPVEFVQDILKADPDPEQKKILRSLVENQMTSVRSGHGIGKSAVEVRNMVHVYSPIPEDTMHSPDTASVVRYPLG